MKLTCSKDLLLQYINIVNKAVSNRTTLPILECILLTANERGFIMTGNDLEIGIRTAPIEAEIQEAGEVAIEARIFNEIVRRLNGESVTIATDEDYAVTIVSGSSEFKIMGQSGEDFPTLPEVEQGIFRNDVNYNIVRAMVCEQMDLLLHSEICKSYSLGEIYETVVFMHMRGISTEKGLKIVDDFLLNLKGNEHNKYG